MHGIALLIVFAVTLIIAGLGLGTAVPLSGADGRPHDRETFEPLLANTHVGKSDGSGVNLEADES